MILQPTDHTPYLERGSGPALVMLPGMEGSAEFWEPQLRGLSHRFRVVSIGYRRRFPWFSRTMAHYAADVLGLMDRLKIPQAAVVGESFGGMLAQHLAIHHPRRVSHLVLCNTLERPRFEHLGPNMFTVASSVHQLAFFMPRALGRRVLGWVGRHRGFVMDATEGNAALADYLLDHGLDAGPDGYQDRLLAALKANHAPLLARIRAPTLVLRGVEDRVVGPRAIQSLLDQIPDVELARVERGGHCCTYTMPEECNGLLLRWLERRGAITGEPACR